MNTLQRAYRYFLAEPFYWIFLIFFQTNRFLQDFGGEYEQTSQSIFPIYLYRIFQIVLPSFLLCYPLVLLGRTILFAYYLLPHVDIIDLFLTPAIGISIGIFIGIVIFGIPGIFVNYHVININNKFGDSFFYGFIFGILGGILGGIFGNFIVNLFSTIISTIFGFRGSNLVGTLSSPIFSIFVIFLIFSVAGGIGFGFSFGYGFFYGFSFGFIIGILGGILVGIVIGFLSSILSSILSFHGSSFGFDSGIVFCTGFIVGYYRLPLYLASGTSSLIAYILSRQTPPQVLYYLQHSSLHWDERVYLRLPYLTRSLIIACDEDPQKTLEELRFIDAERPQQLWAARAATLELAMRDLEECKTLKDIAEIHRKIEGLFPRESKLMKPQWATPFSFLSSASLDAQRYTTPISRRAKQEALVDMLENLKRVRSSVAFRSRRMNTRLAQVIAVWTHIAGAEQQRLESIMQAQGTLDNPYKPGIVLQNVEGNIFVGRRDIAEQLESALRTQDNPPTFFMNGERRMGKTSTLVQLPRLLGSRYISVFYNLQSPGIYASTAVFLEWLAERLQRELQNRDMRVRPLYLQGKGQSPSPYLTEQSVFVAPNAYSPPMSSQNDALAYHNFNRWLEEIEKLLEREGKMVLLAFDEFEMFEKVGADNLLNLPTLFDWFRELIQFHPRIALLFSGVSRLEEMGTLTGIHWTNYFINVRTVHINFLREKDARDLIMKPTEQFLGEEIYSEDVVTCILQETGCHPLLVQAVCSALIDMLNVEHRVQATLQDVKETIHTVIETWGGYFDDQWERTDQNQRTCLAILLAGPTNMIGLERQSGLEDQILRQTMRTLLRRDLVRKNDDETYEMTMPMFARWMRLNDVV